MNLAEIWASIVDLGILLVGVVLTASPSAYLRFRNSSPWLRLWRLPLCLAADAPSFPGRWRHWRWRARSLGVFLILLAVLLFGAIRRGTIAEPILRRHF
jgi:hypothetical protein